MDRTIDDTTKKVLQTIHDFLNRLTEAGNLTSEQLTEAFMCATSLGYQIARMDYPEAIRQAVRAEETAIAKRVLATPLPPAQPRRWAQSWDGQPDAMLCAGLETHNAPDGQEFRAQVRDLLVRYYEPMDAAVGAGTRSAYAGGRGDAQSPGEAAASRELDAEGLEAWLRQTGNAAPGARVSTLRRLMGGYSKATYVAKLDDGGQETTVVIRKDGPGLPTGSSVVTEFPVLAEMDAIGVPVPAPLWLETDLTVCGGAFMGVAFARGTPANQIVPEDAAVRRSWARSCAEVIGRIHMKTALSGGDVREPVAAHIDDLEARMLDRERAPHPGLLIGLKWLRGHLDTLRHRPACRIHGDFGFHNMLMHGDRVSALLDWEFSCIGDPVEDLASIKTFMEQIEAWDEFYAAYRETCGFTLDPVADRYFTVWREARNMVACLGSLNSLLLPGVKEVPLTVSGTIYIPKFEIAIFDAIAEAEKHHG